MKKTQDPTTSTATNPAASKPATPSKLVLDNLSALNAETCDRLCSYITGGVTEKRTLHTDEVAL